METLNYIKHILRDLASINNLDKPKDLASYIFNKLTRKKFRKHKL